MQQLGSGCIEEVTRLEMRVCSAGSLECWEPGQEVLVEEAHPQEQGNGSYQQGATQWQQEVEETCFEDHRVHAS